MHIYPIENIKKLKDDIDLFEKRYDRKKGSVSFVAVSKGQSFEKIEAFSKEGVHAFGENYVQEAIPKIIKAKEKNLICEWHFIGRLQSNKLATISQHFDWVQTLQTRKQAETLDKLRSSTLPPLQCCIQIPVQTILSFNKTEVDKHIELFHFIHSLKHLSSRGLMCLIPPVSELDQQRKYFAVCREVFEYCQQTFPLLDTLSMGMSSDFEAAIAEGATLLRIGTALFGQRHTIVERDKKQRH